MPRFPGFIGGSATTQSTIADAEETINLYVERMQSQGAQNEAALFPTPGFTSWASVADVGVRALAVAKGRLFGVLGAGFYEFDLNGTATRLGTVTIDANPAQIIFNGVVGGQLGIAAGGNLYCLTLSNNAFSQVLTGECTMVSYAAGFGLAFNLNTGKVRLSNLNDLSVWDAGTFFQRSLFADPWQAMFVDANNLIWLIGTDTFEVWYNTGTGTQPWAPLSGLVGRVGIAAPFAFGVSGSGNFWLARNAEGLGRFVVTQGGAPQTVSTYPVNTAIAGYLRNARVDDAEVFCYEQEGHTFAVVAFPSAQPQTPDSPTTWAYDIEGQSWAKRGRWTNGRWDLWAPRCHTIAFGRHLIGDRTTGKLWTMDTATATDIDGAGIRRLRRAPHVNVEHARIPIDQLEILMDVGLGVATGQGSDPIVMMRDSIDGGRTWRNERQASTGRLGEYRRRAFWTRFGSVTDWVVEVSYSEPTPYRMVDAWINSKERAA